MNAEDIRIGGRYVISWDDKEEIAIVEHATVSLIATEDGNRDIFWVRLEGTERTLQLRPALFVRPATHE